MATEPIQQSSFVTEHIALNVPDPLAMVEWYTKHLRMTTKRKGGPPTHTTFLADVSGNILLELFFNKNFPVLEFGALHPMTLHLAVMTSNISGTRDDLLRAGATLVEDVSTAQSGDSFLMMRDPWGFALQFVRRAEPMFSHTHLRPEHIAFNVRDSRSQARWYAENLGLKVKREGGAPGFGFFLADPGNRMMVELYQNVLHPMLDLHTTSYMSVHLAFSVDDVAAAKDRLQAVGATTAEDVSTTPSGDTVLMLRDPWGLAVQCVKRVDPMVGG